MSQRSDLEDRHCRQCRPPCWRDGWTVAVDNSAAYTFTKRNQS